MSLIIGVLGRPNILDNKDIISFSQAIIDVIKKYDAIPLGIIPSNKDIKLNLDVLDKDKLFKMIDLCDGVILQGGKDCYEYDIEAIKYINNQNIPVLGICLGAQSLAIASGGSLDFIDNHKLIDKDYAHSVKIDKQSMLYKIIKKINIKVNSRHEEVIINPGEYNIVGWSSDNTIEAIEKPNKNFNIGVQWHPENLISFDKPTQKLFNAFFKYVNKYHINKNKKL